MAEELTVLAESPRADWANAWRSSVRQLVIWAARGLLTLAISLLSLGYVLPVLHMPRHGVLFRLATLGALARTMSFQIGLLLLIPLAAAIVLRKRWLAVGLSAVTAWTLLPAVWSYRPKSIAPVSGETLRVMTYNLLRPNRDFDGVAAEVAASDPDVICFQEYAAHWEAGLSPKLAERYPYHVYKPRKYDMGLAIYSKRPFVGEVEAHDFDHDPPAPPMRAVIDIDGRHVALYDVHMHQPFAGSMSHRLRQFTGIREQLAQETLPVIIAGDYNATPTSPILSAMAEMNFADAWDIAGWGRGTTWPDVSAARHLPGIRIDHVYLSADLTCTDVSVGKGHGSDHRPVIADIGFK
ncbi:MAG: endonuclease/exonuclease/phosphatase family protein [Phycisphaerales bacterium]|nr:endonuclease/exonuclease/phosphatase family protein [Phycisphaerales bacterium]